jgi:hypothetical protein
MQQLLSRANHLMYVLVMLLVAHAVVAAATTLIRNQDGGGYSSALVLANPLPPPLIELKEPKSPFRITTVFLDEHGTTWVLYHDGLRREHFADCSDPYQIGK